MLKFWTKNSKTGRKYGFIGRSQIMYKHMPYAQKINHSYTVCIKSIFLFSTVYNIWQPIVLILRCSWAQLLCYADHFFFKWNYQIYIALRKIWMFWEWFHVSANHLRRISLTVLKLTITNILWTTWASEQQVWWTKSQWNIPTLVKSLRYDAVTETKPDPYRLTGRIGKSEAWFPHKLSHSSYLV